jgi:leucyl/phenylalanyl-tRNA--protein transferase
MPVYKLGKEAMFPKGYMADEDGLLAFGGKLNAEFLLEAYAGGIFPWYNENEPILWWCPNPRSVIFVEDIHISKSMKKLIKSDKYKVTMDEDFEGVIESCKTIRKETWINNNIKKAYIELHKLGVAHSVEVWSEKGLVGGLYGVSIGRMFFGESMFSNESNTSKLALISLCVHLQKIGMEIIDCQVHNSHLESMGAVEIPRDDFFKILERDIAKKGLYGKWYFDDKIK